MHRKLALRVTSIVALVVLLVFALWMSRPSQPPGEPARGVVAEADAEPRIRPALVATPQAPEADPEPVPEEEEEEEEVDKWATEYGRGARAFAELTDGQLVVCPVAGVGLEGRGEITTEDPSIDLDRGIYPLLPYRVNAGVEAGELLFNALPGTREAVFTTADGLRARITWAPSEDGSPVTCDSVELLSQRIGVYGRVELDRPLDDEILTVRGCGGSVELSPGGGDFFVEIDSVGSCELRALVVGMSPVPYYSPAASIDAQPGRDVTGVVLRAAPPESDPAGAVRLLLDYGEGAQAWWNTDPNGDLSDDARAIQGKLNGIADQFYELLGKAAAHALADEEIVAALTPETLDELRAIAED